MTLKWETFKKLSTELQQEYVYRFIQKNNNITDILIGTKNTAILMLGLLMIHMFVIYFLMTSDCNQNYDSIKAMIISGMNLIYITMFLLITVFISGLVRFIYHEVVYYRWKRKNNIKGGGWRFWQR